MLLAASQTFVGVSLEGAKAGVGGHSTGGVAASGAGDGGDWTGAAIGGELTGSGVGGELTGAGVETVSGELTGAGVETVGGELTETEAAGVEVGATTGARDLCFVGEAAGRVETLAAPELWLTQSSESGLHHQSPQCRSMTLRFRHTSCHDQISWLRRVQRIERDGRARRREVRRRERQGSGTELRWDCKAHIANKLALHHDHVLVCEVCEQAPTTVTCKVDAATLCVTYDQDSHSANPRAPPECPLFQLRASKSSSSPNNTTTVTIASSMRRWRQPRGSSPRKIPSSGV
ncbi:unnamed protein product [Fraxinus pennsylvanica]|uniref:Uncharacterized protein n=1 Tax=Fraxinus pennsylvanica TaxID=56036 RepID=A0AAD2A6X0_9LAMI|nr:unnamed protein product [Fraxinus pennsylvanica]